MQETVYAELPIIKIANLRHLDAHAATLKGYVPFGERRAFWNAWLDRPTWGNILGDSRAYLTNAPWFSIFAGVAIVVAVLGFNLVGNALRDRFDPRRSSASA